MPRDGRVCLEQLAVHVGDHDRRRPRSRTASGSATSLGAQRLLRPPRLDGHADQVRDRLDQLDLFVRGLVRLQCSRRRTYPARCPRVLTIGSAQAARRLWLSAYARVSGNASQRGSVRDVFDDQALPCAHGGARTACRRGSSSSAAPAALRPVRPAGCRCGRGISPPRLVVHQPDHAPRARPVLLDRQQELAQPVCPARAPVATPSSSRLCACWMPCVRFSSVMSVFDPATRYGLPVRVAQRDAARSAASGTSRPCAAAGARPVATAISPAMYALKRSRHALPCRPGGPVLATSPCVLGSSSSA